MIAAAAVAGILFLRTPDHHARLNPSTPPVVTESPTPIPAASSKPALNEDRQQKTDVPSSNQAAFEDKQQEIDGLSSKQAQNEDETPAPSSSFAGSTGESPARRPRVALRLHAASVLSTGQQSSVTSSEYGGQPAYSSPGVNTTKPAPAPSAPTIPLEAHYVFWPESRFRVYLGAGVKAEKSFLVTGGEPLKDPFQFSLRAGLSFDL